MDYRREIDGLRALAVVPVILFHAGFEYFSGGFVGVDVFLVISGYLITTIILNELEQDRFSILNFYERRARRILPTLFLIIMACIPFAWTWLFSNQLRDFSKSLIAVAMFVSNFLFWQESGYFDTAAELKPLLHTWSLAVEEQFYVLFPLLLVVSWRLGKRWTIILLSVIFAASLSLAQRSSYHGSSAAFYLLPTRAWELLIGTFVAIYLSKVDARNFRPHTREVGGWLGLALILISIFTYSKQTPFPSLYTLVPTIGAALIILFVTQKTVVGKFFGNRLFVGIGLISYSAYLWHQPLLALGRSRSYGSLEPYVAGGLASGSFILAYISWLYVETPIRTRKLLTTRRSVFLTSALGTIFISAIGLYGILDNSLGKRLTPQYVKPYELGSEYVADNFYLISESWELQRSINGVPFFGVDKIEKDRTPLFDTLDRRKKLLVVGNSHSVDFYNVMHYSKKISSRYQLARFGIQIRDIDSTFFSSPNYISADTIVYCSLSSHADIDHVERVVLRAISDHKTVFFCKNMFTWMERANFTKLDRMIIHGLMDGIDAPNLAREINHQYSSDVFNENYVNEDRRRDAIALSITLDHLSKQYGFKVIDRMGYVCPGRDCRVVSDSLGKYFFDMGHHTMAGAKYFAGIIDNSDHLNELVEGI